MKTPKRQFGDLGENLAERFLMKHGFSIIEKNYLKPWGEIDIVAERLEAVPVFDVEREKPKKAKKFHVKHKYKEVSRVIHFVEVKTVSCEIRGNTVSRETFRPEENMHRHKLRRLQRAIETYVDERKVSYETPFRVDLVTVRIDHRRRVGRVEMLGGIM